MSQRQSIDDKASALIDVASNLDSNQVTADGRGWREDLYKIQTFRARQRHG